MKLNLKPIDLTKIILIILVGLSGIISIILASNGTSGLTEIASLCLGGLLGYLAKDVIPIEETQQQ